MASSSWTATQWDDFHRTGVEPPEPDVPPFRLEGLETRDPIRVHAVHTDARLGDGYPVRGPGDVRTTPNAGVASKPSIARKVTFDDAKRVVPKILAGWNVTFFETSSVNEKSSLESSLRSFAKTAAAGFPSVRLSRPLRREPKSIDDGGFRDGFSGAASRHANDAEVRLGVFPDVRVGVSLPFCFLGLDKSDASALAAATTFEAGADNFGKTFEPRGSRSLGRDARSKNAFGITGTVTVSTKPSFWRFPKIGHRIEAGIDFELRARVGGVPATRRRRARSSGSSLARDSGLARPSGSSSRRRRDGSLGGGGGGGGGGAAKVALEQKNALWARLKIWRGVYARLRVDLSNANDATAGYREATRRRGGFGSGFGSGLRSRSFPRVSVALEFEADPSDPDPGKDDWGFPERGTALEARRAARLKYGAGFESSRPELVREFQEREGDERFAESRVTGEFSDLSDASARRRNDEASRARETALRKRASAPPRLKSEYRERVRREAEERRSRARAMREERTVLAKERLDERRSVGAFRRKAREEMAAEKARAKESAEDTRKMIREAEAERIRRERFASNVAKGKEASGNAVETVPPAVFSSVGRLLDDGGGGGDGGSSPESNAEDSKPELATAFGIRNAPARETAKAIEKKTKEEARSAAVEAENETKKKLAAAREETRRRAERELKEIALAAEKRAAEALKEADRSRRREREELKIQRRREKESFAAAAEEREAWERAASKTRRDREKAAENERRIAERFEREKKNAEIRVVLEEGRKKKKERGRARVENAYPPANDRVRGGDVSRRRDAGTPTIEPERSTRSSGTLDRLGSAIVLVPGHWIDPGEETGSPGEREFNKAIADLTQAKLQGFGWTVIRPDLFSPPMRWREYADWASDRCAFGVPLLEIHGQGKDAAAIDGRITGVISQVGEDVSPLGDALAERFGRFPMDWRELLVSRVGGAVVESFETDYLESLGRRERERHMDGVAANIAEAVDSVKSRAKPAYGCSASGCPRDP